MSGHDVETQSLKYYRIDIRPHTDIRRPAPGFIEALAEHLAIAAYLAEGRIYLTAPNSTEGDGTPEAIERVLQAAVQIPGPAARRVQTGRARYSEDGHCHLIAQLEREPVGQESTAHSEDSASAAPHGGKSAAAVHHGSELPNVALPGGGDSAAVVAFPRPRGVEEPGEREPQSAPRSECDGTSESALVSC